MSDAGARAAAGAGDVTPLVVSLLHASLEHATHCVMVGHFAGYPLTGPEARLDDRLDQQLSLAQLTGDYPSAIDESRQFAQLEPGTPPYGVIVVGLGLWDELTEEQLTSTVSRALVRYGGALMTNPRALRAGASVATRDETAAAGGTSAHGISTALIGTRRPGGLTVLRSVRAIVAATVRANAELARIAASQHRPSSSESVRATAFDRLEFVTRLEDLAELAAHALYRLASDNDIAPDKAVRYEYTPREGEGRVGQNPPVDEAEGVWTRFGVTGAHVVDQGIVRLTYAAMGRLARSDRLDHDIDRTLIDSLVADSISRTADERVGTSLFELLIPQPLKQGVRTGGSLQLLLDETTADYPWELLTPRPEPLLPVTPLALAQGALRQFVENAAAARTDITRAAGRDVLVIGNPPPGQGFQPLPGAATEAHAVVSAFSALAWPVTARIWDVLGDYEGSPTEQRIDDPAEEIIHELLGGSWRVIHIAGHGVVDASDAGASGVVLGNRRWLTPTTLAQLSIVPDLVVVNACHLGAVARELTGMNKVAASFARRLMQIGVKAVIAAGWAVDDEAASTFAATLYGELLDGGELGDAVLAARRAVHATKPASLTWGAYQCYGDPGFRLAPRRAIAVDAPMVTRDELRRQVRAARERVSDQTSSLAALRRAIRTTGDAASGATANAQSTLAAADDSVADVAHRLARLASDPLFIGATGTARADLCADFARAYAELGDYDTAIEMYTNAVAGGGREVPVSAIEQLANLSMRRAVEIDASNPRRGALVVDAHRYLTLLDQLGTTDERHALWGSFYKRRATIASGYERAVLVVKAARRYGAAHWLRPALYHELNARQLSAIAGLLGQPIVPPLVVASPNGHDTRPAIEGTFWDRSRRGDLRLTELVESSIGPAAPDDGEIDRRVSAMVDDYESAFRLRSSGANRRSVIEHIGDIADLLPPSALKDALTATASSMLAAWT